jgi:hypothetical protein
LTNVLEASLLSQEGSRGARTLLRLDATHSSAMLFGEVMLVLLVCACLVTMIAVVSYSFYSNRRRTARLDGTVFQPRQPSPPNKAQARPATAAVVRQSTAIEDLIRKSLDLAKTVERVADDKERRLSLHGKPATNNLTTEVE